MCHIIINSESKNARETTQGRKREQDKKETAYPMLSSAMR